jgi:hypothetical protein
MTAAFRRLSPAGGGTDLVSDRSRRGDVDAPALASSSTVAGSSPNAASTEPTPSGLAAVSLVRASTREGRRSNTGEGDPGGGSLACRPPATASNKTTAEPDAPGWRS